MYQSSWLAWRVTSLLNRSVRRVPHFGTDALSGTPSKPLKTLVFVLKFWLEVFLNSLVDYAKFCLHTTGGEYRHSRWKCFICTRQAFFVIFVAFSSGNSYRPERQHVNADAFISHTGHILVFVSTPLGCLEFRNAKEPVLQLLSRIGNPKNQSISEMKICRFVAPQTTENIHLKLKKTPRHLRHELITSRTTLPILNIAIGIFVSSYDPYITTNPSKNVLE